MPFTAQRLTFALSVCSVARICAPVHGFLGPLIVLTLKPIDHPSYENGRNKTKQAKDRLRPVTSFHDLIVPHPPTVIRPLEAPLTKGRRDNHRALTSRPAAHRMHALPRRRAQATTLRCGDNGDASALQRPNESESAGSGGEYSYVDCHRALSTCGDDSDSWTRSGLELSPLSPHVNSRVDSMSARVACAEASEARTVTSVTDPPASSA